MARHPGHARRIHQNSQPVAHVRAVPRRVPPLTFALIRPYSIRFDPEWKTNGYDQKVVQLFTEWVAAQAVPGLTCEVLQEPNRTPLIFIEVPATGGEGGTVLMLASLFPPP